MHFQIKLNLFCKRRFLVLEINERGDRLQLKDIEKQNPELLFFKLKKKLHGNITLDMINYG